MNKKTFIIYLFSIFICAATLSCGNDKEEKAGKKGKGKKEQTESAQQDKDVKEQGNKLKKPISGLKLPESNDNAVVGGTLSAHTWKLSSWQVGSKKATKAPNFTWTFNDNGGFAINLKKDKKLKGGWAYTQADEQLHLALPGSKGKNNTLSAFAQPFKVVSIADSLLHIKNDKAELRFVSTK